MRVMALTLLLTLTACADLRTIDKKIGDVMQESEQQYCSHSKPHRELIMDEVNEKLTNSDIKWECKNDQ